KEMNKISKILFWSTTILLGFVNPLISVGLVVVYYLPKIISDLVQPCEEVREDSGIKSYSDDVLEDMK
ncbi:MAG: hypothetical protein HOD60_01300, partial [Candidatus Nitrosopelagicus sp.]|nr:hypothetical protein [Candidatus Nitrosopelagicus sp.]